jgi:hypothetical protein
MPPEVDPLSAAQNYDSVDSQRGERLLTHTQFAATFRSTATPPPPRDSEHRDHDRLFGDARLNKPTSGSCICG